MLPFPAPDPPQPPDSPRAAPPRAAEIDRRPTAAALVTRYGPAALLVAVAATVRLVYQAETMRGPFFDAQLVDSQWHVAWATRLAAGDLVQDEPFFRAPLYPFFLALLMQLGNGSLVVARVAQHLLGAVGCLLIAMLGRRLYGPAVGWVAGWFAAFYGPLLYFENELLIPALIVPLFTATLLMVLRGANSARVGDGWWAGVLLGLCAIARPNFLAIVLLILAWGGLRALLTRRGVAGVIAMALGAGAAVAPVTFHNVHFGGEWVLIASQGGANFYIGNNPAADGRTAVAPGAELPLMDAYVDNVWTSSRRIAEEASGGPLSHGAVSRYWFNQGVRYWVEEPAAAIELLIRKVYYFFNGFEIESNRSMYLDRENSSVFSVLTWHRPWLSFPAGVVIPLALLGTLLSARDRPGAALLRLVAATYALTVIAFFVTGRFRMPLVPIALIFAARAVVGCWAAVRGRAIVPLAVGAVACAGLALVVNGSAFDVTVIDGQRQESLRAAAHLQRKDYAAAVDVYTANLARDAGGQVALRSIAARVADRYNLAMALQRMNHINLAIPEFERAVALMPGNGDGHVALADAYAAAGRVESAIEAYHRAMMCDPMMTAAPVNLGVLLITERRFTEAALPLQQAIALAPERAQYYYLAGVAARGMGRIEWAIELFLDAARRDADSVQYHEELGLLLLQTGQLDAGINALAVVARAAPERGDVVMWMGLAVLDAGRLEDAEVLLLDALERDESLAPAHCGLAAIFRHSALSEAVRWHTAAARRLGLTCPPDTPGAEPVP